MKLIAYISIVLRKAFPSKCLIKNLFALKMNPENSITELFSGLSQNVSTGLRNLQTEGPSIRYPHRHTRFHYRTSTPRPVPRCCIHRIDPPACKSLEQAGYNQGCLACNFGRLLAGRRGQSSEFAQNHSLRCNSM